VISGKKMKLENFAWLMFVVVGLSTGQLLFKLAARSFAQADSLIRGVMSPYLAMGLLLYGGLTMVWIWQLTTVDLGRAYPLMALTFVIVPILSTFVLGELVGPYFWIGVGLIFSGLIVLQLGR
jgi:drug/metabolite transporter (DMT)-like permease